MVGVPCTGIALARRTRTHRIGLNILLSRCTSNYNHYTSMCATTLLRGSVNQPVTVVLGTRYRARAL